MSQKYRDVSPFIKKLRNAMMGRDYINPLRYEPKYSARTQPAPVLPEGPSHKLSGNYYYLRDARQRIETPLAIVGPEELKKLADPSKKENRLTTTEGGVKPGKEHNPAYIRIETKEIY